MTIKEQIEQAAREYATHWIDTKETDFYGKFIQEKGCDPAEERGFIAGARWAVDNLKSTWIKYNDEKPKPKYRAFKTKEECWEEMHKHSDFGWVIAKDSKIMYHIYVVGTGYVLIDGMSISFSETFAEYEFTDGIPFGIKEE